MKQAQSQSITLFGMKLNGFHREKGNEIVQICAEHDELQTRITLFLRTC